MKKAILFFFITACISISAQEQKIKVNKSLDLSYYSTDVGTNICGEYNFNFESITFFIGLKCHINRYIKANTYLAYHHQFVATHPLEYIGGSLGFKIHFKEINPYVQAYFVYNAQYANLWTKYRNWDYYTNEQSVILDGPYHAIENTGGLGLTVKLTDKFYFNQSAGVGVALFNNQQPGLFQDNWNWEFMYQWRLGISLKLN
jgi:hypothetical protein